MAILNYETPWEGATGLEVETFIKSKLQASEDAANQALDDGVTRIVANYKNAGQPDEDQTTIVIQGFNSNGDVVTTSEFSTITEASYTQHINDLERDYSISPIVARGQSLDIPYDYYVLDENNNKVAGYAATVKFTILCGGNKKTFTTTTYRSTKSSVVPLSHFTIPAELFGVGTNTINISAVTTVGTKQTAVYETQYQVYVADLKLAVNVTSGFANPRSVADQIRFNFTVTDSNGNPVSGFQVKKRIYISRIGPSYLSSYANNISGDYVSGTFEQYLHGATSFQSVTAASQATVRFIVEAYITDGEQEYTSNKVMLQMLCLEGMQSSPDTPYVAAQFNDVFLEQSVICTSSKQYSKTDYNFYLYSVNASNYSIVTQLEGEAAVTKASGSIPASELSLVEYGLTYRDAGKVSVTIGSLSFDNYVTALSTGMAEPTGAALSLSAAEKAAGASDQTWTDGTTTCDFNGFDWISNGWVNTEEGTALVINNGAALAINYSPFDRTKYSFSDYPYTISFRYKITNGSDESEELIKCLASDTGFLMKPQYVELNTSSRISQSISNEAVHEITLVYYGTSSDSGLYKGLQAIYIDGTIQAITEAGAFVPHTSTIEITASTASIYLYSVKAFRRALSFTEIQSLYCFNQNDTEKISSYVTENDLFKTNTVAIGDYGQSLDRTKLPKDSVVLVLYGRPDNPTPWATINGYVKDETDKKRRHALAGAHLYVVGYAAHAANFYMVGGTLGAQGTSSMAYPIKNYRLYLNKNASKSGIVEHDAEGSIIGYIEHFYQGNSENPLPANFNPEGYDEPTLAAWDKRKAKSNYFTAEYSIFSTDYENPETGVGDSVTSAPANRFCLKADYAESSGVHNTGFARFSNEIMKSSATLTATDITSSNESTLTPPQYAVSGSGASYKKDVRMNIDGRPIYLFGVAAAHTENGVEIPETEYYLGRYNFNNDKSNVKVFGFEGITDYEANAIMAAEGKSLQMLALQSGIDPYYAATHNASPDDEYINPTECWEFSSNDGISREMGSFHYDKNTAFTTTLEQNDPEDSSVRAVAWLNATWEYRYPDLDAKSEGDLHYRRGESRPYLLTQVYNFLYDNNYSLNPSQNTLNRFADNLHFYFNVNSVVKYFILTHWFLCLDQRIKNSMLAFYCDPYGVSSEEAASSPMHYMRGYYIFYDNDTILGLDNAGAITNPWDFYETDTGNESLHASNYNAFPGNGMHGLWTNLQKCYELYRDGREQLSSAYKLGSLVANAYIELRKVATDEVLHSYFDNKFPDAVQNVDLEVKYLNPNQIRTPEKALTLPQHLEMAQGTREFHRDNLLTKRTLWLDDLYGASTYKNYMIQYKTTSTDAADNGTVAFTISPNFRFWNFMLDWSELHRESGMVTAGQVATLPAYATDRFSISDFVSFSDLYACKSIDFTNYNWDPTAGIGQTLVYGTFPYLEDFKIHPVDGAQTISDGIPWATPASMPNLKSLVCCNMIPRNGNSFGSFLLRNGNNEFSKLESLDLRGTPISEVVFPNSAALKTINLDNPVTVSLVNKPNVSSINIGIANLNNLVVRTSSSAVYSWALAATNSIIGANQKEVTIVFGESAENPYVISSDNLGQLELLNQIAEKVKEPENTTIVNISGNIFTSETFDSENIGEVFQNLNITDQLSGDGFTLSWQSDLYEDSVEAAADGSNLSDLNCLMVRANMDVVAWSIKIDNQDGYTMNNKVSIVKTTKQRCYIHADPYEGNSQYDGRDHKIVVYAQLANGDIYDSYSLTHREINIYYQPINYLSVSTTSPYVVGDASPITFTFNAHTKKHLLTRAMVETNVSNYIATATNNATVTWRYDIDDILVGANVTLGNQSDTTVSFNLFGGVRASITVFYDSAIVSDFTEINNNSELYWLAKLRVAINTAYTIGNTLKKSDASSIVLNEGVNYWASIISALMAEENVAPQNFDALQYFQLGSGSSGVFTIPAIAFTNISFPVGTTGVIWNALPTNVSSIRTVKARASVRKMVVSLTSTAFLDNLVIDLSETSIEKIGAFGSQLSALDNNVASVELTFASSSISGTRSTSLFAFPPTLRELGNRNKTITDLISGTPATLMFNLTSTTSGGVNMDSATVFNVPYALFGFANPIKVGALCSYRSKGNVFGDDWSKINDVAYTFVYNNNTNINDGVFTLPGVQVVGNCAFYHGSEYSQRTDALINEVRLNSNVITIGDNAFSRCDFRIVNNANPSADVAVFEAVESVGASAFYLPVNTSLAFRFGNTLNSVGSNAFACVDSTSKIDVYINKTDALQNVQASSFGGTNSTRVDVYVPAGSALYTQLTASGMDCANRVHPYNFT